MTTATTIPRAPLVDRLAHPRYAVPLLLLLAAALRLPYLGESLWFDEVMYSTRLGTRTFGGLWRILTQSQHGPFYPAVLHLWTAVAGESELMVRLPSLVLGLGSIALAYLIARRFGGDRVALVAGFFLCLSPVHVWYSQEATPYAMALCLLLGAMHVQPRVAPSRTGAAWLGLYVFVLAAAVLCHAYVAVFLLPLTLTALRMQRRTAALVFGANVSIALLLAAILLAKYQSGRFLLALGFARPFTLTEWWSLFFGYFLQGHAIWSPRVFRGGFAGQPLAALVLLIQVAAAAVLLRGLLSGRDGEERSTRWELAAYLFVLPVVLWVLTNAGARRMYIERYQFTVLPFFAIALARGTMPRLSRSNAALACGVLALAAGSYGMWLQKDSVWTVYKPNPDWQSTVGYLRSEVTDARRTAIFGTVPLHDLVFYLRREMRAGAPPVRGYSRRRLDRALTRHGVTTVHLVHNRFWGGRFGRALDAVHGDPRLRIVKTRSFKGVTVYTFRRFPIESRDEPDAPGGGTSPREEGEGT